MKFQFLLITLYAEDQPAYFCWKIAPRAENFRMMYDILNPDRLI